MKREKLTFVLLRVFLTSPWATEERPVFVFSYMLLLESAGDALYPHGPPHGPAPVSLVLRAFSGEPHLLAQVASQQCQGMNPLCEEPYPVTGGSRVTMISAFSCLRMGRVSCMSLLAPRVSQWDRPMLSTCATCLLHFYRRPLLPATCPYLAVDIPWEGFLDS